MLLADLKSPLCLYLSNEEKAILWNYKEKVALFGLLLDEEENENLQVEKAPNCFLRRDASAKFFNRESPLESLMHDLAKELVQTLKETGGSLSLIPKTVLNVIKSQACRGKNLNFGAFCF